MKMHNPASDNSNSDSTFPALPTFPDLESGFTEATIDAGGKAWGAFVTPAMIKAFLVNASTDEVRVGINQVRIEHHAERTILVATDGHRLAWLDLVVPLKERAERARVFPSARPEVVYHVKRADLERAIKYGDAGVAFGADGKIVPIAKVKGEKWRLRVESPIAYQDPGSTFPPWLQVVPKGFRPADWAHDKKFEGAQIKEYRMPEQATVEACAELGAVRKLAAEYVDTEKVAHKPTKEVGLNVTVRPVGFNGNYMSQACTLATAMCTSKSNTVRYVPGVTPLDPMLVIGGGDAGFAVTVLMPMRV